MDELTQLRLLTPMQLEQLALERIEPDYCFDWYEPFMTLAKTGESAFDLFHVRRDKVRVKYRINLGASHDWLRDYYSASGFGMSMVVGRHPQNDLPTFGFPDGSRSSLRRLATMLQCDVVHSYEDGCLNVIGLVNIDEEKFAKHLALYWMVLAMALTSKCGLPATYHMRPIKYIV